MRPLFRLMLPQTTPPQELSVHGRTAPHGGFALAVLAHVHALLRAGRLRGRGPVLHLPLSGFADPRLDQRVQWPHVRHRLVGAEDPAQCPGADADLDRGADPCHPGLPAIGWEAGFYYYLLMFIPALFSGNRFYRRAALAGVALWL